MTWIEFACLQTAIKCHSPAHNWHSVNYKSCYQHCHLGVRKDIQPHTISSVMLSTGNKRVTPNVARKPTTAVVVWLYVNILQCPVCRHCQLSCVLQIGSTINDCFPVDCDNSSSCVLECNHLPSIRQHLSYDDCLEDKRENYQNCSVLYCVTQLCTVICTLIWTVLTCELF